MTFLLETVLEAFMLSTLPAEGKRMEAGNPSPILESTQKSAEGGALLERVGSSE